jgi:L-ascorbate metabolism protein UlaG (beta-lactamase superfamily)
VFELTPSNRIVIDDLSIIAVETAHPTAKNAMGFIIQENHTIYFPGDTALSQPIMEQIGTQFKIDLALLPIGCYRGEIFGFIPASFKRFHMGPDEIIQAIQHLQPKKVIPIHWGTFIIGSEPIDEARKKLDQILEKKSLPILILDHGRFTPL